MANSLLSQKPDLRKKSYTPATDQTTELQHHSPFLYQQAIQTILKPQGFYSLFKSFSNLQLHPCMVVSANTDIFWVFLSKNNSLCKLVKIACWCQRT